MALAAHVLGGIRHLAVHPGLHEPRRRIDVMFLEELADLKDRYPARLALHHVLSREQRAAPLLSGRIDAEKLDAILDVLVPPGDGRRVVPLRAVRARRSCAATPSSSAACRRRASASSCSRRMPTAPRADRRTAGRHPSRASKTVAIEFTLDGLSSTVESAGRGERGDPQRRAARAPRRAVRVRGRRVRHLPGAADRGQRADDRELRARARRARARLRADLPVAPHERPGRRRLRRLARQETAMIELTIDDAWPRSCSTPPTKLNALDETAIGELDATPTTTPEAAGVRALVLRGEGRGVLRRPRHLGGRPARRRRAWATSTVWSRRCCSGCRAFPAPDVRRSPRRLPRRRSRAADRDRRRLRRRPARRSARRSRTLGATLDSGRARPVLSSGSERTRRSTSSTPARLMSGTEAVQSGLFSRVLPGRRAARRARSRPRERGSRGRDPGVPGEQGAGRRDCATSASGLWESMDDENARAGGAVRHRRLPRGLRGVPAEARAAVHRRAGLTASPWCMLER